MEEQTRDVFDGVVWPGGESPHAVSRVAHSGAPHFEDQSYLDDEGGTVEYEELLKVVRRLQASTAHAGIEPR